MTRPALTTKAVTSAAVALVRDRGADELSMRSLATELGVTPMALYRHVSNKNDLVRAVATEAMRSVAIPEAAGGWRPWMSALAYDLRAILARHRGLAGWLLQRGSVLPEAGRAAEAAVARLMEAGFTLGDATKVTSAVMQYVLGRCYLEDGADLSYGTADLPADERRRRFVESAVRTYPEPNGRLAEVAAQMADMTADDQFAYGLDHLLLGIEVGRHAPTDTGRREAQE